LPTTSPWKALCRRSSRAVLVFPGQVRAALTRVLVSEARHDEIVEALANVFNAIPVGDPCEATTGTAHLRTAA
jgi:acyl-CoA reductase-like NAD-dependent aldehyde dehydrogenase